MTTPTAARRRARFGAMTAILLAAVTVSVVTLNLLAARYNVRADVTITREHALAPRTGRIIASLRGDYEIVIAAAASGIDARARERVRDVLAEVVRAGGGRLTLTTIDTSSDDGVRQYDALLRRLAERDAPRIAEHRRAIGLIADGLDEIAAFLDGAAPSLESLAAAIPADAANAETNRRVFTHRASEARVNARALRELADKSRKELAADGGTLPVANTESAALALRKPLADLEAGMRVVADDLARFGAAEAMPASARDMARPLGQEMARRRDRAAILGDTLDRLPPIDLLRIAHVLESSRTVLVIGPPEAGLNAIDFDSLYPSTAVIDTQTGAQADLRRNGEELIATALAALARPFRPIVVVVHGQPAPFFTRAPGFEQLMRRLTLRGIDVLEWAAAAGVDPPDLARFDPSGNRPVVYIALSTDSSINVGQGQSGPERAAKLGKALSAIVDSGRPLLLSIYPSTLPAIGEADPAIATLASFGLQADTGRPILREQLTSAGRTVAVAQSLRALEGDHPLLGAARGLPTLFEWPIALRPTTTPVESVNITPLYRVEGAGAWAESQWLTYWKDQTSPNPTGLNPPQNDSARDDPAGPWTVAIAATRTTAAGPQRFVAIGANTWFTDRVTQDRAAIDGRPVPANPGNMELFEAAVYWLAGQDDLIGQSATARAVPLIQPAGTGTLRALRWLVIAGMPGLVLLAGLAWRAARG